MIIQFYLHMMHLNSSIDHHDNMFGFISIYQETFVPANYLHRKHNLLKSITKIKKGKIIEGGTS